MPMPDLRETIARIAAEDGADPAYALATADRESSFNPNARASKTIAGMFQMSGALRRKYGVPDGADPETQVRGFTRFTRDLRNEMASHLGREPTNAETYLGHYWGGPRAARVISGSQGALNARDIFSPQELAANPKIANDRRSAGAIATTIMGDFDRRMARYGGPGAETGGKKSGGIDFSAFGAADGAAGGAGDGLDFSAFGQAADEAKPAPAANVDLKVNTGRPGQEIDLAQFGLPIGAQATQANGPAAATQGM